MKQKAKAKDTVLATLVILGMIGGMIFLAMALVDNFIKKAYQLEEVYYSAQEGKPTFLLHYSDISKQKNRTTRHEYLHQLSPEAKPRLASKYFHFATRNWSSVTRLFPTQGDTLFVFRSENSKSARIFPLSLQDPSRQLCSEEELIAHLTQKYPELLPCLEWEIGQDNSLYWTTEMGQKYRILLPSLSLAQTNKTPQGQAFSQRLIKTKDHVSNPSLHTRIKLQGEPRQYLYLQQERQTVELNISPFAENQSIAQTQNSKLGFLKGQIIRPFSANLPVKQDYQSLVFVAHQSSLNAEKAELLLSKIDVAQAKELYRINLSKVANLKALHQIVRSALLDGRLFLFLEGNHELNFVCLQAASGQFLWKERLAYGGSFLLRAR
ncbi:MAG: hypothetical protein HC913_19690 [Microscillaceae bacterium]|nr:hypothetical protein [Microscillaceae bacterium]